MHSIKNNKPTRKSGFVQGYFPILECKKYVGKGPIIYRSSWEKKFCLYCERHPEIIMWSSESLSIKYFSPIDEKYHTYYPDFLVKTADGSTIIVEVKPKAQLKQPNPPKRKTPKQLQNYKWLYTAYITNLSKRKYAEEYAASKGWKYMIVTEDFFRKTANSCKD